MDCWYRKQDESLPFNILMLVMMVVFRSSKISLDVVLLLVLVAKESSSQVELLLVLGGVCELWTG